MNLTGFAPKRSGGTLQHSSSETYLSSANLIHKSLVSEMTGKGIDCLAVLDHLGLSHGRFPHTYNSHQANKFSSTSYLVSLKSR